MEDQYEVQLDTVGNACYGSHARVASSARTSISMTSSASSTASSAPPPLEEDEDVVVDEFRLIAIDHVKKKNDPYSSSPSGIRVGLKGGLKGGDKPIRGALASLTPRSSPFNTKFNQAKGNENKIGRSSDNAAAAHGGISGQSCNTSGLVSGIRSGVQDRHHHHHGGQHGNGKFYYNHGKFPNQVSIMPRSSSSYTGAPSLTSPAQENRQEDDEKKFELMSVRLTMYGLSGIICEQVKARKTRLSVGGAGEKRRNSTSKNNLSKHIGELSSKHGGTAISSSTVSSLSSIGDGASMQSGNTIGQLLVEKSAIPTTAVVSCEKNAVGSQISLQTYLPSMPLKQPVSVFSNKASFSASWPLEKLAVVDATEENESNKNLSSFQIVRCMQSAGFTAGNSGVIAGTSFRTQHVELQINLSRGTDIFPIGIARVALSGDEEQETVVHVPVQGLEKTSRKRFGKIGKSNKKKRTSFESDPTLKWSLEDNATMKVGIQVIPQKTLEFGEEMETKKKEDELRQLLQQDDIATLLLRIGSGKMGVKQEEKVLEKNEPSPDRKVVPRVEPPKTTTTTSLAGILCGALPSFCGSTITPPAEPARIPAVVGGNNQLLSILSSVSESTDGMTHYDDDGED